MQDIIDNQEIHESIEEISMLLRVKDIMNPKDFNKRLIQNYDILADFVTQLKKNLIN